VVLVFIQVSVTPKIEKPPPPSKPLISSIFLTRLLTFKSPTLMKAEFFLRNEATDTVLTPAAFLDTELIIRTIICTLQMNEMG
jgi:hypothetical protein